ncbi:unnamed protein product [Phytophthora lilii]|uniref:Unnamed protein product n=1 Tax=Phytophthora lilii TaxID=2077276 RepID=A0A9W6XBI7_9STRA|nr:unnamed protein product [Phytophthora lilii]
MQSLSIHSPISQDGINLLSSISSVVLATALVTTPAATASSNSTSSGKHATFGTITSKAGECVVGNPNTYISTKDLQWVWDNRIKDEVMFYV